MVQILLFALVLGYGKALSWAACVNLIKLNLKPCRRTCMASASLRVDEVLQFSDWHNLR